MNKPEHLQTLLKISERLNSLSSLESLLNEVMDLAMNHLAAERGLLIVREGDRLTAPVARNLSSATITQLTDISTSIVHQVFRDENPLLTYDAVEDDRFKDSKSIALHHIRSIICLPLRRKDAVIGVIYMDSRRNRGNFNQESVDFLMAFANQAAIAIENTRLYEALREENSRLQVEVEQYYGFGELIGQSPAMQTVFQLIQKVVDTETTVLIEGESGTGKELVARAIHYTGARKNKPFIARFCGALPENLLESELFGFRKGAFTGADHDKIGLFESAHGGTFFLDEISEISPALQAKLLRVLQEREIWRVGETKPRSIDVRFITATNKSLSELIKAGTFREDLFFRLNVYSILLPPLRERGSDIILLAEHFLRHFADKTGKKMVGFTKEALKILRRYHWPGNVRELQNIIERALILTTGPEVTPEDLRLPVTSENWPAGLTLKEFENQLLLKTLRENDGNRTKAAKILDVSTRWIQLRLKELGESGG